MRILLLLGSIALSLLGLFAFIPLSPSLEIEMRLFFAAISLAIAVIMLSTLLAASGKRHKYLRNFVSVSCAFVPGAWFLGCLDRGIISTVELVMGLFLVIVVTFQWFVFESFRVRNEA